MVKCKNEKASQSFINHITIENTYFLPFPRSNVKRFFGQSSRSPVNNRGRRNCAASRRRPCSALSTDGPSFVLWEYIYIIDTTHMYTWEIIKSFITWNVPKMGIMKYPIPLTTELHTSDI